MPLADRCANSDQLVQQATSDSVAWLFKRYQTTVEYVSGLLPPGANGINHGISTDGRVAVLTVSVSSAF